MNAGGWIIRLAAPSDIPVLTALIDASVRGLQARDYTPAQIDGALRAVYGVDTQLIADGTYFVVEAAIESCGNRVGRTPRSADDAHVGLLARCMMLITLFRLRTQGTPGDPRFKRPSEFF